MKATSLPGAAQVSVDGSARRALSAATRRSVSQSVSGRTQAMAKTPTAQPPSPSRAREGVYG